MWSLADLVGLELSGKDKLGQADLADHWTDQQAAANRGNRVRHTRLDRWCNGGAPATAGITVQMLLDVFEMAGIVHYGVAGSSDDSLFFGDVYIPFSVAFTGSWTWR